MSRIHPLQWRPSLWQYFVVRLRIELEIGRDEEETSLERKLRHIDLINALAIGPAVLGALAMLRRLSDVGMFIEG